MKRLFQIASYSVLNLLLISCGKALNLSTSGSNGNGYLGAGQGLQVTASQAAMASGLLNINYTANSSSTQVNSVIATFSDGHTQALPTGSECLSSTGSIFTTSAPAQTPSSLNVTIASTVNATLQKTFTINTIGIGSDPITIGAAPSPVPQLSATGCNASGGALTPAVPVRLATSQIGTEVKLTIAIAQNVLPIGATLPGYVNFGDSSPSLPVTLSANYLTPITISHVYASPATAVQTYNAHVVIVSPNGLHAVSLRQISVSPLASTVIPAATTPTAITHYVETSPGTFINKDGDATLIALSPTKPTDIVVVGPDDSSNSSVSTGGANVFVYSLATNPPTPIMELFPFGTLTATNGVVTSSFKKGVRVALGDVDGDGNLDIIAGSGDGTGVRILSGSDGHSLYSGQPFNNNNNNGYNVGAVDLNSNGTSAIVLGDNNSSVYIYSLGSGGVLTTVNKGTSQSGFGGGIAVAGYGANTIAADGNNPNVNFSTGSALSAPQQIDLNKVINFNNKGIYAALGMFGTSTAKTLGFVVGSLSGPDLTIVPNFSNVTANTVINIATPFGAAFKGGVTVGTGDLNGDGITDIIAGAGADTNTVSAVQFYNGVDGSALQTAPTTLIPYAGFKGGIFVGGYSNPL